MSTIAASPTHVGKLPFVQNQISSDGSDQARSIERCIENEATELLDSHPHFRGRNQRVKVRCLNGYVFLSGNLPSYYLKQLAQEALRSLSGVSRIENQIVVASPSGEVMRNEPTIETAAVVPKPHMRTGQPNPKPR